MSCICTQALAPETSTYPAALPTPLVTPFKMHLTADAPDCMTASHNPLSTCPKPHLGVERVQHLRQNTDAHAKAGGQARQRSTSVLKLNASCIAMMRKRASTHTDGGPGGAGRICKREKEGLFAGTRTFAWTHNPTQGVAVRHSHAWAPQGEECICRTVPPCRQPSPRS